jgi:hypothetical protein
MTIFASMNAPSTSFTEKRWLFQVNYIRELMKYPFLVSKGLTASITQTVEHARTSYSSVEKYRLDRIALPLHHGNPDILDTSYRSLANTVPRPQDFLLYTV